MTLDEREAAQYLGVSVHALRKWRPARRGPRFVKLRGKERAGRGNAGRILYREEDLRAFLDEMTVPTENPMPAEINPRRKKAVDLRLGVSETLRHEAQAGTAAGVCEGLQDERLHGGEDCRAATEALGLHYPFDWRISLALAADLARRGGVAPVSNVQGSESQEVGGGDVSS
jgi:hypothetical protein